MGTATKTFTEYEYSSYKATWTITMSRGDATIESPYFELSTPTLTAKYVYSGKKHGYVSVYGYMTIGGVNTNTVASYYKDGAMTSGTTYTISKTTSNPTIYTGDFWNSSNPTTRTLSVVFHNSSMLLWSMVEEGEKYNQYESTADWWWTVCNATLNAPPTIGTPTVSKNTSNGWYAGLTTISVSVPVSYASSGTSATAKYGGYVTKITLTVGGQTLTKTYTSSTKPTSAQTLSFKLNSAGTFTPKVTITDSRGQTSTKSLSSITVQKYTAPSVTFGVYRTDNTGVKADEGSYGLITAKMTYTSGASNLTKPTVKINGTTTNNVTWYSTAPPYSSSSTPISNWNNVSSGATVYGLINGSFATTSSYQISMSVTDTQNSSSPTVSQTLSTAFYTIDFKAGGKEIAFGASANDNLANYPDGLFKCNMATSFTKDLNTSGNVRATGYLLGSNVYVRDKINPIGWYDAHGSTTSISSGTSYASISASAITLSAGRYIMFGSARFAGNATGYRGICVFKGTSSVSKSTASQQALPSASWTTSLNCSMFEVVESSTTYYLGVYQNSGGSLSVSWDFYAVLVG